MSTDIERQTPAKAVVRRFYQELFNTGDMRGAPEILAPDYVHFTPRANVAGVDGIGRVIHSDRLGFPDVQFTLDEMVQEGDTVVAFWTARGTHTGETDEGRLNGIPPTGRKTRWTGVTKFRVAPDGRIRETRILQDQMAMLEGLGVLLQPPRS